MDNANNIVFQRLNEALNYLRGQGKALKNIEIVEKTGMTKGVVSSYLSGKIDPSPAFIEKFCKAYGLNAAYILYGQGSLGIKPPSPLDRAGQIIDDMIKRLDKMEKRQEALDTDLSLLKKLIKDM